MKNNKYTEKCTTVYDCYKLSNKQIDRIAKIIVEMRKEFNLKVTRTAKSYANEIKAHKRAYLIGYKRSHSKDADLEENITKWNEIKYRILGR